ncbi:MAG: hypothetical protein WDZ81_00940 [Candidatus Saccharimonadales bacterium]
MSIDLILLVLIGALVLVLLRLKSHIKFVALGLFLGIVLAQFAAGELLEFINRYLNFNEAIGLSVLQLLLIIIPAVVLGLNHYHARTNAGLIKPVILALLTSLLALSSLLEFLPNDFRKEIIANSFVAGQLSFLRLPLILVTALALLFDRSAAVYAGKKRKK